MNTALVTLNETASIGKVFVESGLFPDLKSAAQATVKILAGRELGFGPFASVQGISIIQNRVDISANLMAALVKGSPGYDYRVREHTDKECTIEFFQRNKDGKLEPLGKTTFTMQDAATAGLAGKDNWKKYPRNMLFSRCMKNGARWYCPDLFSGLATAPEVEDGEATPLVDIETGEVIEGHVSVEPAPVAVIETPVPEIPHTNGSDPLVYAKRMLDRLESTLDNYYFSLATNEGKATLDCLLYSIKLALGDVDWGWPATSDKKQWSMAFDAAVKFAQAHPLPKPAN